MLEESRMDGLDIERAGFDHQRGMLRRQAQCSRVASDLGAFPIELPPQQLP
jgi:hypothetical protein